jgi:hypothetical protein
VAPGALEVALALLVVVTVPLAHVTGVLFTILPPPVIELVFLIGRRGVRVLVGGIRIVAVVAVYGNKKEDG